MADFDDDNGAVEMGGGGNAPAPRRRIAADFDDEDEAPAGEGEQAPQTQSRPPMKSWGDSASTPAQPQSNAVAVESGNISSNMNEDTGASSGDVPKQGFGRRAAGGRANNAPKDKYDTDTITDITEIPDVEEEPREADLASVVAEAPNVRSNRVQALQELDQQILFQLPSAMGDGIDLSLLTSSLSPQTHVAESDQLWEFDQLFADVSSEMQAEMEPDEKEPGEEGEEADDENAGVAKGDGKKAAAPIRDRSNRPVANAAAASAAAASSTEQQQL